MSSPVILTVTEKDSIFIVLVIVCLLFCVFGIIITCTCDPININNNKKIEGYYNYCGSCEGKTIKQCMQCANCGFLSKKGYGKCVEGDSYGPYDFNPDYVNGRWIHNDQYWTNILTTDDTAIPTTHVYNNRYPYYRKLTERKYGKAEKPKLLDQAGWIKIEHDMIKPTYEFNAKIEDYKPEGRTLADSSSGVDAYSNDIRTWLPKVF